MGQILSDFYYFSRRVTFSRASLTAAGAAAMVAARATDLVGWAGGNTILMIMPETTPDEARVAAARWRNEMWLRSRAVGGQNWDFALVEGGENAPLTALPEDTSGPTPESGREMA